MIRIGALVLALLTASLAGCVSSCPPSDADASGERVIMPGDVLNIVLWGEDDVTGDYEVGEDGAADLILISPVPAAGRTPDELVDVIRDRLGCCYVVEPRISVAFVTPTPSCRPADQSKAAEAAARRVRERLALQVLRRRPPPQEPHPAP